MAKLALFWKELIGFHALENLAFAAFILFPAKSPIGRKIKTIVTALLALALLYHDSWLPTLSRAFSQASVLSSFSFSYLVELIGRFISLPILAMLIIAWVAYWYISRWVRIGGIVIATIVVMAVVQNVTPHSGAQPAQTGAPGGDGVATTDKLDMDKVLQTFYTQEAARSVSFPTAQSGADPFDVIFIHICSLSWDDVQM